jgi:hypothetical protein
MTVGGVLRWVVPFLVIGMAGSFVAGRATAQIDCDRAYAEADAHYTAGAFAEAISVLAPCVKANRAGTDEDRAAHRLLALAYLRAGDLDESRLVIVELFSRNPGYVADPVNDPPAFVSLVNLVREETGVNAAGSNPSGDPAPRTWFSSPRNWLILTGGAAVAAIAVVAATAGGGGGSSNGPPLLPLPPAFP